MVSQHRNKALTKTLRHQGIQHFWIPKAPVLTCKYPHTELKIVKVNLTLPKQTKQSAWDGPIPSALFSSMSGWKDRRPFGQLLFGIDNSTVQRRVYKNRRATLALAVEGMKSYSLTWIQGNLFVNGQPRPSLSHKPLPRYILTHPSVIENVNLYCQ